MSTYTDLHIRRKENLTILRMPGDPNDGITPQRVILANPENIYEGTFKGKIETSAADFNNVTLNNALINGGTISNATIYSDGQVIAVSELTSNISEISETLTSLQEAVESIELSCSSFDKRINDIISGDAGIQKISAEVISALSDAIDESLSSLSSILTADTQQSCTQIFETISSISSFLSAQISNETSARIENDAILNGKIQKIAVDLQDHVDNFNEFSAIMSTSFDNHVNDFNEHIEDNIKTFDFLSNFMLSSIEHDRHYQLYNTTAAIPYEVKDFAVNVVRTGTTDIEIKLDAKTVGYGTFKDASLSVMEVTFSSLEGTPLLNAIPSDPWQKTLTADVTYNIGGNKFYTIRWYKDGNSIELQPIGSTRSDLVYANTSAVIGTIKNPEFDVSGLVSGTMVVYKDADYSSFNVFYDAFGNLPFDRDSSYVYNDEYKCSIKLNDDLTSFIFGTGVEVRDVTHLVNANEPYNVFAFIRREGLTANDSEIAGISVENIYLSSQPTQQKAVLSTSNNFKASIGNGIYISCDTQNGNVFDIVKVQEKYQYNFYSDADLDPDTSLPKGIVIPELVNEKIYDREFEAVKVVTNFVDSGGIIHWNDEYVLSKTDESIWTYESGDKYDTSSEDYVKIVVRKSASAGFRMNITFIDSDTGFRLDNENYTVDIEHPSIYSEDSSYELLMRSKETDFTFDITEQVPEKTYVVLVNAPVAVEGNPYHLDTTTGSANTFKVRVPPKDSKYYDISREFIVATKVTSTEDFVEVKLYNGVDEAELFGAGHTKFFIPTNVWTAFKVIEVKQDKFLMTDLDDNMIRHRFDRIENDISAEVSARISADGYLESKIDSNKSEIDDLWKNIRGGLNYIGNIHVGPTGYDTVRTAITDNFVSDPPEFLREGFFFLIQAEDKAKHYNIEGLEVEHGDWMIMKHNTPLSSVTSSDVAIHDAQDYDNFKLNADNNANGNNTFTGNNVYNGDNTFNGATHLNGQLSVDGQMYVNGDISIDGNTFAKSTSYLSNAIISKEVVEDSYVKTLSLDLSSTSYTNNDGTTSSLYDLSNSLQNQMTSAQLSISNISSLLEEDLSNEVRYFGTLERGYGTVAYLKDFLAENIGTDATVHKGFWYRISSDLTVDDGEYGRQLFKNDYIIFNATKKVSEVLWRDIDIIRDAQSEEEALQTQITYISSIISDDISGYISSIISDYHNTLSGIDRMSDDHIATDNLMLTDVVGSSTGTHSHKKYYMTFLSGTIVMKPMA